MGISSSRQKGRGSAHDRSQEGRRGAVAPPRNLAVSGREHSYETPPKPLGLHNPPAHAPVLPRQRQAYDVTIRSDYRLSKTDFPELRDIDGFENLNLHDGRRSSVSSGVLGQDPAAPLTTMSLSLHRRKMMYEPVHDTLSSNPLPKPPLAFHGYASSSSTSASTDFFDWRIETWRRAVHDARVKGHPIMWESDPVWRSWLQIASDVEGDSGGPPLHLKQQGKEGAGTTNNTAMSASPSCRRSDGPVLQLLSKPGAQVLHEQNDATDAPATISRAHFEHVRSQSPSDAHSMVPLPLPLPTACPTGSHAATVSRDQPHETNEVFSKNDRVVADEQSVQCMACAEALLKGHSGLRSFFGGVCKPRRCKRGHILTDSSALTISSRTAIPEPSSDRIELSMRDVRLAKKAQNGKRKGMQHTTSAVECNSRLPLRVYNMLSIPVVVTIYYAARFNGPDAWDLVDYNAQHARVILELTKQLHRRTKSGMDGGMCEMDVVCTEILCMPGMMTHKVVHGQRLLRIEVPAAEKDQVAVLSVDTPKAGLPERWNELCDRTYEIIVHDYSRCADVDRRMAARGRSTSIMLPIAV